MRSAEERQQYLDGACAGDAALRAEVEALLEASARASHFLESPAAELPLPLGGAGSEARAGATIDDPPVTEKSGTMIGPYKLLEQIGEGGFGVVFMAEQTQPVRRRVALKVLKPGMDTRQVVARFEAERQALAIMDHPNIAKVHDGGATASGRPYFVMELVKGMPITAFCDQHQLTPRQRLELFVPVCQAVQHAHHKGIIHRDLKPSNVLVTVHDTTPVVKVIDFGVAKALGQELTDKTLFTGFAQMVGTPLYMSPEQAGQSGLDIDTRSDIYSLGVLLYELLTGTTPFSKERFKEAAYEEIRRIIREEEPPRPSTRLSDSKDSLPSISARRHTEPAKLTKLVRGELDWIVMKALEKDRNRRYETANGFAQDLQRYLADEPVQACPPSLGYRLRKFSRRNKTVLTAAALVVVALVLGIAGSTWQAIEATVARDAESRARKEEQQARDALDTARDEKERQRTATNRDLSDALLETAGLREKSRSARPDDAEPWNQFRAALRRAEALAGSQLADPALVGRVRALQADLKQDEADRRMVAQLEEIRLSKADDRAGAVSGGMRPLYEAAFKDYGLPVFDLDVEEAAHRIAGSRIRDWLVAALNHCAGNYVVLIRRLIPIIQRVEKDKGPWVRAYYAARLGNDQPALQKLVQEPEALQQLPITQCMLALEIWPWGSNDRERNRRVRFLQQALVAHPGDLWINHYLADFLRHDKKAEVGHRRAALAVRPDSRTLRLLLADCLRRNGESDEANLLYRHLSQLPLDPKNLGALADRASYYAAIEDWDKTLADWTKVIELDQSRGLQGRASLYARLKRWDKALADYTTVIELRPKGAGAWEQRASCYETMKQWDRALADWAKVIELDQYRGLQGRASFYGRLEQWDKVLADYTRIIELRPREGSGWSQRARFYEARKEWRKAIADWTKVIEGGSMGLWAWDKRAQCYTALEQWDKAIADWSKFMEFFPRIAWNADTVPPPLRYAWHERGRAYAGLGEFDKALADYTRFIELDGSKYAGVWYNRGLVYARRKQWDKAVADYSNVIKLNPKNVPVWHDRGFAYANLKQWDKAVADYSKAIELDPKFAKAWHNRGTVYGDLKQWDKALGDLTKAIEVDPKFANAWQNRGWAHFNLKQWDKAVADYSKVVEFDPKNVAVWHDRGLAYYELKRWDKAVADYTKAIELNAKLANAWCNRGVAYKNLRQWDKAIADYTKAIDLDPKYVGAWYNRGKAYFNLKQWDKAVADYSKVIELDPKNVHAWHGRGFAYANLKQWDKAVADYSKVIELDHKDALAWNNRGFAYHELRQLDKALADLTKAIELDPKCVLAWNNRGWVYFNLKQWDKAIADYSKVLELDPKDVRAWSSRASAYTLLGQGDKALVDYTKAIELDPKNAEAWTNRGRAYENLKQWDKALADYTIATELDPRNANAHNTLAWLLATAANPKVRDPGRAVQCAKKAVELASKEGDYWSTLGTAHYRAGDWKAARAVLEKSMELRKGGDSFDWFFLAMCHEKLGDKAKARHWYARATRWMDKNQPNDEELRRFRAEAAELLKIEKGRGPVTH